MKITFNLPVHIAEEIVIEELTWHLKYTKQKHTIPMFSHDPKENKKRIKHLQDAFKTVLEYYGVNK